MKLLIFGGTSALCQVLKPHLLKYGEVRCAGRRDCDFVVDITTSDFGKVIDFCPDVVINLCSRLSVNTDVRFSDLLAANVVGSVRIAEFCRSIGVKHYIHFSSIYSELSADSPFYSPYAFSKQVADEALSQYANAYNLPTLLLRPGPIYGDSDRLLSFQPLLASIINSALDGRDIVLYGSSDATRFYIHSYDVCQIVCLAIRANLTGRFDVMPMASVSLTQMASCAQSIAGAECKVVFDSTKPDVCSLHVKYENDIYDVLDYRPMIDVCSGMRREVDRLRLAQ